MVHPDEGLLLPSADHLYYFYAFFVNGDYTDHSPELHAWDIEFTQKETSEEWGTLLRHWKERHVTGMNDVHPKVVAAGRLLIDGDIEEAMEVLSEFFDIDAKRNTHPGVVALLESCRDSTALSASSGMRV